MLSKRAAALVLGFAMSWFYIFPVNAASDLEEATMPSSEPSVTSSPSPTNTNTQDTGASADKFFYDICVKEMVNGMKEGMAEKNGSSEDVLKDPTILKDMEALAQDVCGCAAPKFSKVVMSSLDRPDNEETRKFFEEKAFEAIMECVGESEHPLLKQQR